MDDLVTIGSHDRGRQRWPLRWAAVPIPASRVPVQPAHRLRPAQQDHIDASLAHRPAQTAEPACVLGGFKRRPGIRQLGRSRPLLGGEIGLQADEEITHRGTYLWPVAGVHDDKAPVYV